MRRLLFYLVLFITMTTTRLLMEGSGGGIWNYLQLFFILAGIIYFPKCNRKPAHTIKALFVLSIYIWFLSFFTAFDLSVSSLYYFAIVPYAAMVTSVFYVCFNDVNNELIVVKNKAPLNRSRLNILFSVLLLGFFYLIAFLVYYKRNISFFLEEGYMGINSYYLICLLPLVLIFHNPKLRFIPFIVAIMIVLFTAKRTGLLVLVLMILLYAIHHMNTKKNVLITILLIGTVGLGLYFGFNSLQEEFGIDMLGRVEMATNDGGSGRLELWGVILNSYDDSNDFQWLFGHGYQAVNKYFGMDAHNDFIQILFDYGLFACLLYIFLYVSFFIEYLQMRRREYPFATYFLMSIISSLLIASLSFFIVEPRFVGCAAMTWGIFISDWKFYKSNGYSSLASYFLLSE